LSGSGRLHYGMAWRKVSADKYPGPTAVEAITGTLSDQRLAS
jgi:hypothetical protein